MPRVGSPLAIAIKAAFLLASISMSGAVFAQAPAAPAEKAAPSKSKQQAKQTKKAAPAADAAHAAPGKIDAAEAQRQIEAAQKSLDGGKPDLAINQANALMARSGLDSKAMARILAIRGQAHRKQGKPAQAISDLQAALELKGGLGESERATVTQYRAEAYKEAGLGDPKPLAPGRPGTASNVQTASTAKPPEAPTPPQSGNFFTNLFGGGSPPQPPKPAPAQPAVVAAIPQPTPPAAPRAATVTPVVPAAASPAPVAAKLAPAAAAEAGRFRLQLGAVRSRQEAQTLADKVKTAHAGEIGNRSFEIDEAVFGNMGTFYRVRIGPFADAETSKSTCAALRAKGVDCMVITQ